VTPGSVDPNKARRIAGLYLPFVRHSTNTNCLRPTGDCCETVRNGEPVSKGIKRQPKDNLAFYSDSGPPSSTTSPGKIPRKNTVIGAF
jgi:hypothetical protein